MTLDNGPGDNSGQITEWNGLMGQRWAELQAEIDGIVVPFGNAALGVAAAQAGERVIDVGCGCGFTTLDLARSVGPAGRVLGVDVSRPMLQVARQQAERLAWRQVSFEEADASQAALPAGNDLLFSRFGVMFFAQPVPAFSHLRQALRPKGRCVFVCWGKPRDNVWAMAPLAAARQAAGVTPVPVDPHAPGPFAFADGDRLRTLLSDAGFADIALQRFDAPVVLGATARLAAQNAVRIGPTSRLARELGSEHLPAIIDAVESALTPLAAPDGRVSLNGSTWIVSASNP